MREFDLDLFEEALGSILQNAIEAKGLQIKEVAEQIGTTGNKLGKKLHADRLYFRPAELYALCKILDVSPARAMEIAYEESTI